MAFIFSRLLSARVFGEFIGGDTGVACCFAQHLGLDVMKIIC